MRAGRLRHVVEAQAATTTKAASGEEVVSYATVATFRAEIEPLRGDESVLVNMPQAVVTHRITARAKFRAVPSVQYRLKYTDRYGSTRYFGVVQILDRLELGREVDILAKELVQ